MKTSLLIDRLVDLSLNSVNARVTAFGLFVSNCVLSFWEKNMVVKEPIMVKSDIITYRALKQHSNTKTLRCWNIFSVVLWLFVSGADAVAPPKVCLQVSQMRYLAHHGISNSDRTVCLSTLS
jgi:hypothetical protein